MKRHAMTVRVTLDVAEDARPTGKLVFVLRELAAHIEAEAAGGHSVDADELVAPIDDLTGETWNATWETEGPTHA